MVAIVVVTLRRQIHFRSKPQLGRTDWRLRYAAGLFGFDRECDLQHTRGFLSLSECRTRCWGDSIRYQSPWEPSTGSSSATPEVFIRMAHPGLSPLWSGGFNTFHAKVNLFRERRGGLPALSVGFIARTQVRNVGGVILGQDTHNQDFYVVATKTITRIRKLPLVFNAGFKATNASLLGLAGNAPGYYGRGFGAAGFAFKGPGRSTILLGSEVMQEPRSIEGLPGAVMPTTITYAVRIVPSGACRFTVGAWRPPS